MPKGLERPVAMVKLGGDQVCNLVEIERFAATDTVADTTIITDDTRYHRAHPCQEARRETMVVGVAKVFWLRI